MAYRRRQGITRSTTFKEGIYHQQPETASSSSLAAQAIKASAAHRDSSHSKGGGGGGGYDHNTSADSPFGFWGNVARKAKEILEEDSAQHVLDEMPHQQQVEFSKRMENNVAFRKGLDAFTSSMRNALEEGRTIVENTTADLIKRRGISPEKQKNQTSQEDLLKASRDVAMATAAKVKLLLRELKTVKADLSFAKQRCSQLEEENKILREAREKGLNPADDDMIRLQLETLLAEKARLANENSVYARENRFLREIVEYHQLTMQDVVYLDEGIEEVTPV
ncbi:hypothetical protein M569_03752, partial [Genlisea aurea]